MDTLFFWASKIIWLLISPASMLVLWLGVCAVLLMFDKISWAKKSIYTLAVIMVLISILPFGKWMLHPLEHRFETNPQLPERIDGIVVLSGSEDAKMTSYQDQMQVNGSAERILMFMKLALDYPEAKLVYTGGSARLFSQEYKEADVAKRILTELRFDISRVQFERNARNTAENAKLSYEMVKPKPDENWVLITTAWHMPRSYGLFCQVGWQVIPYPVDHQVIEGTSQMHWAFARNIFDLNVAVKEWLGLLAYYLAGKTPELFPQDCRSSAR